MQLKYMTERVAHSPPVATCMLSPLLRKLSDFGAFAFALALRSSDCSHALKREERGGVSRRGEGLSMDRPPPNNNPLLHRSASSCVNAPRMRLYPRARVYDRRPPMLEADCPPRRTRVVVAKGRGGGGWLRARLRLVVRAVDCGGG